MGVSATSMKMKKKTEKPAKPLACGGKEVKGVVDDDDPETETETERVVRRNEEMNEKEGSKPKGMPHEQVPQPGDFSAEALDKDLPPTQA